MKALPTAICAFGAAVFTAVSVSAGNVTIPWDASATPATLGEAETGLLEFTYIGGVVSNITAHPVEGGTIVMTGDQIDVCSLSHVIMANAGELVFSNAVHGSWNIYCESAVQNYNTIDYSGANLDTSYKTIFANQNLSDWMPLKTGNVGGKGWWRTDDIPTYNIRREADGSITAQRQAKVDTHLCGVVKFQLKQSGADIAGRCVYAGYWNDTLGIGKVGDDADAVIANPVTYGKFTNNGVSTPSKDSGYGINKITMSRVKGLPTVRFAGGLNIGGVLYARAYTHVVYERAVRGGVGYGYQADGNGILTFRDPTCLFDPSSNANGTDKLGEYGMQGAGTVEFEATDTLYGDETHDVFTTSHAEWIPTSWVTVAEGQKLANLISNSVTAVFGGASIGGSYRTRVPLQVCNIAPDGQSATGQFQQLGSYSAGTTNRIVCVLVAFRQNGDDVQMQATGAAYYNGSGYANLYGKDMSEYKGNGGVGVTVDNTHGSYGVHDLSLQFRSPYNVKLVTMGYYFGIRAMAGATTVPGCKAQLVLKGTDNTKMRYAPPNTNAHVMPETDGLMRVLNGGEFVQLKAHNSYDSLWVGDKGLIRVEKGGAFKHQAAWGPGVAQRMEFIGGEFRAYDISTVSEGQLTANQMTFTDNAKFYSVQGRSGDYVRAGYSNDAVWTVRGTLPSTNDIDLIIWAYATGNKMTFAVGDVAEGSDFIMNGYIDVHTTYTNTTVYKTGPGTIQLNKYVNTRGRPLILTEGTWLFNASSLASASSPYTIDGGTLAVADGTTNSLGVLTVGENGGGINLGEGATLTFADSSAATWAGTNKVVVTGFAEKSIRFGTAKGGLADTQRRRLRTSDDKQLHIDSEGYLTRNVGLAIIIR